MADVRKIRPSWEHVETDADGNMTFAHTDRPLQDWKEREAASRKVMAELEGRRKL